MQSQAKISNKAKLNLSKLKSALNLSDKQIKQIENFRSENKGAPKVSRKDMIELSKKIKSAFLKNESDKKLRSLHIQMKSLKDQREEIRFKKFLKMKNILNTEQRKKFLKLKSRKS